MIKQGNPSSNLSHSIYFISVIIINPIITNMGEVASLGIVLRRGIKNKHSRNKKPVVIDTKPVFHHY